MYHNSTVVATPYPQKSHSSVPRCDPLCDPVTRPVASTTARGCPGILSGNPPRESSQGNRRGLFRLPLPRTRTCPKREVGITVFPRWLIYIPARLLLARAHTTDLNNAQAAGNLGVHVTLFSPLSTVWQVGAREDRTVWVVWGRKLATALFHDLLDM